jgi:hypothetical protein
LVSACTCTMKTRRRRRPTFLHIGSVQICAWEAVVYWCWSVSLSVPILHCKYRVTSSYPSLLGPWAVVMLVPCCLLIFVQSCLAKTLPAAVCGIMNIYAVPFSLTSNRSIFTLSKFIEKYT